MVLFRHPQGYICLFVLNSSRVIQTPKTNDLQLAFDYPCKWMVILNNVYLPLIGRLLLLFCGQDPCPSPFKPSWVSLYTGFYCPLVIIQSPLRWTGHLLGGGNDGVWGLPFLFISKYLDNLFWASHFGSIDGEKSNAVQISEVKNDLKKGEQVGLSFCKNMTGKKNLTAIITPSSHLPW